MVINLFQHRDYRIVVLNLTPSLSRQVMCEVSYTPTGEHVSVSPPAKHIYLLYTCILCIKSIYHSLMIINIVCVGSSPELEPVYMDPTWVVSSWLVDREYCLTIAALLL